MTTFGTPDQADLAPDYRCPQPKQLSRRIRHNPDARGGDIRISGAEQPIPQSPCRRLSLQNGAKKGI
jgi:hypothetical protein